MSTSAFLVSLASRAAGGVVSTLTAALSWVASATPGLSQAQSATGTGTKLPIQAQKGKAGSPGGILGLYGGAGGTPGTDLGGAVELGGTASVGGVAAPVSLVVDGGSVMDIAQTSAAGVGITLPTKALVVTTTTSNVFVISGGFISLQGGGGVVGMRIDGTGIGFNGAAPVAKATITGSRATGAAVASLLTYLALRGDIVDGSSA